MRSRVSLLAGMALVACTPRPTANLAPVAASTPEIVAPEASADEAEDAGKARWIDISVESEFGCAVERSGSIFCWGRGPAAEMELRELPEQPPPDPMVYGARKWGPASRLELAHDARRVSTASSRACALVEDGRVRCWGSVRWGSQHVYDVAGISKAVELAIGDGESCVILENGELWCWGAEDYGLPSLRLDDVVAMAVGDNLACGLSKAGDVMCWGQAVADWRRYDTQFKQQAQPPPTPSPFGPAPVVDEEFSDLLEIGRFRGVVDIALTGWNSLCVLRKDGQVSCGTQDVFATMRSQDMDLREIPEARGVIALSSTRSHACGRTSDERALCWGRNVYGQLGDAGSQTREHAAPVAALTGIVDLSVAEDFSCALTRDDRISCWGFDRGEALGREELHVHTLTGLEARSIAAFGRTTCAVDEADELRCWGSDMLEQAGIAAVAKSTLGPSGSSGDILGLSTGWEGCLLRASGALQCGNWTAAPGVRLSVTTTSPDVHSFAAGAPPYCTIAGQGRKAVLACGRSPTMLEPETRLRSPTALSAANMRACVVHGGGQLSCFAELYSWTDQPSPPREITKVSAIHDAVGVSSSTYHDCALLRSGKVSCWVARTESEWSEDGRTPKANHYIASTVQDMGLAKVTQLVAGAQHHCALIQGGAVRCWGDNPYAEGTEWKQLPELPDDIVELAAGSEHTCARSLAGAVTCWGDDVWGQLGRVPSRVYLVATELAIE